MKIGKQEAVVVSIAVVIVGAALWFSRSDELVVPEKQKPVIYGRQFDNSFSLYALEEDIRKADTVLIDFPVTARVVGTVADSRSIFVSDDSQLFLFNPATKHKKAVASLKAGHNITNARASLDGSTFAYVSFKDDIYFDIGESFLNVVSFDGAAIKTIPLGVPGKYAGFSIVGMSRDGQTVFIRRSGGDAGEWFERIERLDIETGERVFLRDANSGSESLSFINHEGTKLAYIDHDLYQGADTFFPGCLSTEEFDIWEGGDEIVILDAYTGKEISRVENSAYEDNVCKNKLREFNSLYWSSEGSLFASSPTGIYEVSSAGNLSVHYQKPFFDLQALKGMYIADANKDTVVFESESTHFVFSKGTGKLMQLGAQDNTSYINIIGF